MEKVDSFIRLTTSPEDSAENQTALEIAHLGVSLSQAGTFRFSDATTLSCDWEKWREQLFCPLLRPVFQQAHGLGSDFRIRELICLDQKLSEQLPDDSLIVSSRGAAKAYFEGKEEMRQNREWSRFAEAVERGETPGHLVTTVALQSVLYHLALLPALTAYSWIEFESAFAEKKERAQAHRDLFLQIQSQLLLADNEKSGDDGESPFLSVV